MGNLTVFTDDDPERVYPSQDVIWGNFEQAFQALWGLVTYAPVFREYYYRGLQEFYSDNVMYLELRALLPEVRPKAAYRDTEVTHWSDLLRLVVFVAQLYELDGSTHDRVWTLKTYQDVTRQFKDEHPDFFGARMILSVHRWLLHFNCVAFLQQLYRRLIAIAPLEQGCRTCGPGARIRPANMFFSGPQDDFANNKLRFF